MSMILSRPTICGALCALAALVACSNAFASGNLPVVLNPGGSPQSITRAAKYELHLTQSPEPAYVDDPQLIIGWNVEHTLHPGYHFVGHIVNKTEDAFRCANDVYAKTHKLLHRGEEARLDFEAEYDGYSEWCDGRFELSIAVQRNTKKECIENLCEFLRNLDAGTKWFLEAEIRIFSKP
jgi:hypothetical protein